MKKAVSKILSIILTVLIAFLFCCCEIDKISVKTNNNSDLKIVTTIFPYFDFTRNIVGDKANVSMLLSPGAEVHNFEPSPSDIISIENCDLFIYNGGESDAWVEKILSSLEGKVNVLRMFDYVDLHSEDEIKPAGDAENDEHLHSDDHSHAEDEEEYDEHIWTSPKNAVSLCTAIASCLCDIDSKNVDVYTSNLNEYINKLNDVDDMLQSAVDCGVRKEIVVGDRFPFLYLTKEYAIESYCAFPGCSSETEPSVKMVTSLIDTIKSREIPVVFHLEMSSMATAKILCEDTGAKPLMLHSCQNISKDEYNGDETYISLMLKNAENLKEALS